jgi:hypothetical protein
MPVLTKEIELNDGTKVEVRQASGLEKLPFESILAKAFRKFRHFGPDNLKWTDEQQEEFMGHLDDLGGGIDRQMAIMIPPCIITENVDVNMLTAEELRDIFAFVRGGSDVEGEPPLDSSGE